MRTLPAIASACVLLHLHGAVVAQTCHGWTVESKEGPSPRQNHMLSYDGIGVLCFGGYNNFNGIGFSGDTWRWNGTDWKDLAPATSPSARANTDMVFDSKRKRVILFGGFFAPINLDDTWAWNGQDWEQLKPADSPNARAQFSMAYDAARDQVVLFGGFSTIRHGDTWLFDGTTWKQANPTNKPVPRNNHAMAYDPIRQRVVMFGGYPGGTDRLDDTWEWDGSNWTKIPTPTMPPGRQYHDMEYNATTGTIILSCGQGVNFVRYSDTWSYDGTTWTKLDVFEPSPRDQLAITYFPEIEQQVLMGGYEGGGVVSPETLHLGCDASCYPDCDGSGGLDIDDFICFQTLFAIGDPFADCDASGTLDIDDFVCFQTFFAIGC